MTISELDILRRSFIEKDDELLKNLAVETEIWLVKMKEGLLLSCHNFY